MDLTELYFPTLPSTNTYGKEHLAEFSKDKLTLIFTDEQTGGRGRFGGRRWVSDVRQNLTMSFVFFIEEDQEDPLSLTHLLAITTAEVLRELKVSARIKWPNDLMVENKKIGGILCETHHDSPHFGVVIGLGLNVNMPKNTLETVGLPATSILAETGKLSHLSTLRHTISKAFSTNLDTFLEKGFTPFLPNFRKLILPGLRNQHIL